MKELKKSTGCNPKDIYYSLQPLMDPSNLRGECELKVAFGLTSFDKKVTKSMTTAEAKYIRGLITKLSAKFSTVSALRKALSENSDVLNPDDEDTKFDIAILRKIFFTHN